jgi:hypothetical protein
MANRYVDKTQSSLHPESPLPLKVSRSECWCKGKGEDISSACCSSRGTGKPPWPIRSHPGVPIRMQIFTLFMEIT